MLRRMLVLAAAVSLVIVPSALGQEYVAGSEGSGDPFFPQAGNGGYDVVHYPLTLDYDQAANFLQARRGSRQRRRKTCAASTSISASSTRSRASDGKRPAGERLPIGTSRRSDHPSVHPGPGHPVHARTSSTPGSRSRSRTR